MKAVRCSVGQEGLNHLAGPPVKNGTSFSLGEMRRNSYKKAEQAVVPAVMTTHRHAHLLFRPPGIERSPASGSALDRETWT